MDKNRLIFLCKAALSIIVLFFDFAFTLSGGLDYFIDFSSSVKINTSFWILLFNNIIFFAALYFNPKKIKALENEKIKCILVFALFFLIPLMTLCIYEAFVSCSFSVKSFIYALIILYLIQSLLFLLTRRLWAASSFCIFLYFLFLAANDIVIRSRGIPILPQDIFSAKTASAVMGNYPLVLSAASFSNLIYLAACLFALFKSDLKINTKKLSAGLFCAAAVIVLASSSLLININKDNFIINNFNTSDTIKNNGIFLTFILNFKNMKIVKPADYSKSFAADVFNEVKSEESQNKTSENMPNIIVIMNESFSDLSVLGDIDTDDECLTNFNNLKKEGLSGKMLVSVFGGNTANTEFEFLTGLSMAFLPAGSVAYSQYINKEIPTIASWLSSFGYKTIAFHPFWERCWNRKEVYSFFGFDDFISIEDMTEDLQNADKTAEIKFDVDGKPFGDFEYIRGLLSDGEDYREIINLYENKAEDEKLFLFNVTIQNHGGYKVYLNEFENTVKLNNTDEYPDVEQYLTLIQKSDEYLKVLTDYFREQDEPVIILFFGDHQPCLSSGFYKETQTEENSLKRKINKYLVPYLIWSNKDLDKSIEKKIISPNFLAQYLLDAANIEKSEFFEFLSDLSEEVPVINSFVYSDSSNIYRLLKEETYSEKMKEYRDYQYYTLFDK